MPFRIAIPTEKMIDLLGIEAFRETVDPLAYHSCDTGSLISTMCFDDDSKFDIVSTFFEKYRDQVPYKLHKP